MRHLVKQPHIIFSVENSPYPDKVQVPFSHDDALEFMKQFSGGKIYSIDGHYRKPEKFILIVDPSDEQKEAARALAHMTGQESHVESDGYTHKLIYNHGPNSGKVVMGRGIKFHEITPSDYYSRLPDGSVFAHNFDFDEPGKPFEKARVDEGKSPDQKRAARAERQSSWERENYGMVSGASKDPVIAGFMHRAKLYQIRNSPTPKLTKGVKGSGKPGSNYSAVAVPKKQQHLNQIKKNSLPKVPTAPASKITINPEHGRKIAGSLEEDKATYNPNVIDPKHDERSSLKKMSRPRITFPQFSDITNRPDQNVKILENKRQKKLYDKQLANAEFRDTKLDYPIRLSGTSKVIRSKDELIDSYGKRIASRFDRNVLGLSHNTPQGPKSAALAGKLRSKFEESDETDSANMKAYKQKFQEAKASAQQRYGQQIAPKKLAASEMAKMKHLAKFRRMSKAEFEQQPEYQQANVDSGIKERGTAHPHSFYYIAGTEPEHIVASDASAKYTIELPEEARIYDISQDPMGYEQQVREHNNGAFDIDMMHELIKKGGYHGFIASNHPNEEMRNVVAIYHS